MALLLSEANIYLMALPVRERTAVSPPVLISRVKRRASWLLAKSGPYRKICSQLSERCQFAPAKSPNDSEGMRVNVPPQRLDDFSGGEGLDTAFECGVVSKVRSR